MLKSGRERSLVIRQTFAMDYVDLVSYDTFHLDVIEPVSPDLVVMAVKSAISRTGPLWPFCLTDRLLTVTP